MHDIHKAAGYSASRPAVFLDRDGTLIEDVGHIDSVEQIKLFSDTVQALRMLQGEFQLFVITNQSGIAQGLISREQVDRANSHLNEQFRREGILIQEWYVCPHTRENNCSCIKPKPEFVLEAQREYGIDLTRSFVIGDHPHDAMTGNAQGVFGLYVLTGHGSRHLSDLPADKLVFHNLMDAAEWIMSHPDPEKSLTRQIEEGAAAIRGGGVCAFPTETVYGLGADAFQAAAVEQIFRIKGRPHHNPLIVHISDVDQLDRLVTDVSDVVRRLIAAFWPGPLTMVFPKRPEVPDIVTGGYDTVAVRMSAHPIADTLIRLSGTPVAAPSANRFTCTSPTTARHVKEQLGDLCSIVIDGGACRIGVESTVISFSEGFPVVLRPGGVPVEEIRKQIGHVEVYTPSQEKTTAAESPGMMLNHYATATRLTTYSTVPSDFEVRTDIGVLLFQPTNRTFAGKVEILSQTGDCKEAAANLYSALHRLDKMGLREIVAEYAPAHELGHAINDRLSKASRGRKVRTR